MTVWFVASDKAITTILINDKLYSDHVLPYCVPNRFCQSAPNLLNHRRNCE